MASRKELTDVLPNPNRLSQVQDLLNAAHHIDVVVRVNGKDMRIQADWLKHLLNYFIDGKIRGESQ